MQYNLRLGGDVDAGLSQRQDWRPLFSHLFASNSTILVLSCYFMLVQDAELPKVLASRRICKKYTEVCIFTDNYLRWLMTSYHVLAMILVE